MAAPPPFSGSDSPPSNVPPPPVSSDTSPPPPNAVPPTNSGSTPVAPPPVESTPPPIPNAPPPVETTPPSIPSATPPVESTPPPKASAPPPVESTPPPKASAPPPVESTPPPKASAPPPVESTPPPNASAPPPVFPVSPPLKPVTPQTPPTVASPPPLPIASPPPPGPPVGVPPTPALSPPPPKSDIPPTNSPPPPQLSPSAPVRSPPPPPPQPPSTNPPKSSPPPPTTTPEAQPPPAPASRPPPKDSPPSDPESPPPPPGRSPPVDQILPSSPFSPPGSSNTVPSSPSLPSNDRSSDPQNGNNDRSSKGGLDTGLVVGIGVMAGVVILGLIALIAFCMLKRKKRSSGANNGHVNPASTGSSPRADTNLLNADYPTSNFGGGSSTNTPADHGGYGHSRSWFTYQELSDATGGFSDENLLGEGGFGCVYKGLLVDGRVVAVKQLKIGGGQGEREFKAEVEIISRIHHRHLVSLVGYCIWESKRLLVYDYVPNNTLHFHLHGEGRPVMDWATRVKIAVGAARGITYLHEDCHPRVIHRDIKSSNILIDNNYEAQVSDFGLAKLAMDADTHVSTRVMGTFGYMAPEYATSGKLTDKSDVYSFGVVLLELITGRKPVDASQPLGEESLVEWARLLLPDALDTGEFDGLVDPRLEKNYIEGQMFRMIEAAAACVRHSSSKRPKMGQIVRALGESDSGDLSNGLKVGESQLYNSAQQSADIRWFRRMAFGSQDTNSDAFSQPTTQNSGVSTNSRHDAYFSAQPKQGGNSRQLNQPSQSSTTLGHQNREFSTNSRQDKYFSAQPMEDNTSKQLNLPSQNQSRSGQHEINIDILDDHKPDANFSRQTDQSIYHSTDQGSHDF